MEYDQLREGIIRLMDRRGVEALDLGPVGFSRDLQGKLFAFVDGRELPLDRMPPEAYLQMMQAVAAYGRISQDGLTEK